MIVIKRFKFLFSNSCNYVKRQHYFTKTVSINILGEIFLNCRKVYIIISNFKPSMNQTYYINHHMHVKSIVLKQKYKKYCLTFPKK